MEILSMSKAVKVTLERYPKNHEFGLWDLKRDIFRLYPPSRRSHADTVSRRLREYRYGKGFQIICINPNKSRYKKVAIGKGTNEKHIV
jgi:hypothetical protein